MRFDNKFIEPVVSIIVGGYIAGLWPPGFFLDEDGAKIVLHNLIAHVQAYDKISALDDIDADGDGLPNRVGFSHLMMEVVPAQDKILCWTFQIYFTRMEHYEEVNYFHDW